ncbi:putative permease [Poriferisphaera corsica]|uniref:Putative permease n=1 Tax=Poriferisphaera corsica TaxID=2528020 RepID=A0A517YQJ0_9BACT|nr:SO_0444 family Cu/Zn efflux transporter [Poriferisphaera corsica]QDU32487.1 putative permease [Poriferisphaera corsica]
MLLEYARNLYDLSLDAAPWLILGLLVASLIKFALPTNLLQRCFAGRGIFSITRAAVLGTPLPLCSCSVLPAAVTLRRSGASRGSTTSFLIATPENGLDSIAVSYALLGPFMTLVRPIAAITTAITAGVLTEYLAKEEPVKESQTVTVAGNENSLCCSSSDISCSKEAQQPTTCCVESQDADARNNGVKGWIVKVFRYAFVDLYRDLAFWLIVGIVIAASVQTFIPPEKLTEVGSGIMPMLLMLIVGVPLYICATASTPLAAAMLLAGVSPGTALVFLLAGPATNIGSLAIIRREIGTIATIIYLGSIAVCSLGAGLLTDYFIGILNINITAELSSSHNIIPVPIAIGSLLLLTLATLPLIKPIFSKRVTTSCCSS